MKRITVKSFITAVKKTGVVPKRCLWIKKGTDTIKACAIGALAVAAGRSDAQRYAKQADGLGLTSNYVSGFIGGFDGCCAAPNQTEQYELGREDGLACATAAFDEKLHKNYTVTDVDLTPYLTPPDDDADEQYVYIETGTS
jgi:hypothetical protein